MIALADDTKVFERKACGGELLRGGFSAQMVRKNRDRGILYFP